MAFQLWEMESRNCIAEFTSRVEALAAVREMVNEGGDLAGESLLLVTQDASGDIEKVASGSELTRLAHAVTGSNGTGRQGAASSGIVGAGAAPAV